MRLPCSGLLVELTRQNRRELAGERVEPASVTAEIRRELVESDDRGNRGHQAERGREQRFGDARRYHGEAGVLGRGDRLERVHDAPDRAEGTDGKSTRLNSSNI